MQLFPSTLNNTQSLTEQEKGGALLKPRPLTKIDCVRVQQSREEDREYWRKEKPRGRRVRGRRCYRCRRLNHIARQCRFHVDRFGNTLYNKQTAHTEETTATAPVTVGDSYRENALPTNAAEGVCLKESDREKQEVESARRKVATEDRNSTGTRPQEGGDTPVAVGDSYRENALPTSATEGDCLRETSFEEQEIESVKREFAMEAVNSTGIQPQGEGNISEADHGLITVTENSIDNDELTTNDVRKEKQRNR